MTSSCCQSKSKTGKQIAQLANFIKVIDEPNRLKILCLLKQGQRCVCDIFEPLNLSQNLVSHHLKALRDLRLIDSKKEGVKVIYFRNEKVIAKYNSLLNSIIKL